MSEISGFAKTVRSILSGNRYAIDYYQREYKWQSKQVRELVEDLTSKFLESYKPNDDRAAVETYEPYFLGSIVLSLKNGKRFIIDGQQRLTSLTLLLIYLNNRQGSRDDRVKLDDLIFSEKFGKRSFNIDVEDRVKCMEALYLQQDPDTAKTEESVRNVLARYRDIDASFPDEPDEIDDRALPYFADWLIYRVYLVEIAADTDEQAYTIFETMNDRGLSLTPLDMLKGYLLANIANEVARLEASKVWKTRISSLRETGKEQDSDAVKAWLRSQYANTIRERKKNASPADFDRLGTEFHRWVKENELALGLKEGADFARFITRDMNFYTRQYLRLIDASEKLIPGLETVFYNKGHDFTLQYPLLLAPLFPDDSQETIDKKLRLVGTFIDILLARRIWNFRSIAYSTMQYAMFLVMRDIRGRPVEELAGALKARLEQDAETFCANERFHLHQQNRYQIQQLLARMVDFMERGSGSEPRYAEYANRGNVKYEIEHIWADHPERHTDEFHHEADFAEYRNRVGGLLLLPKSFNASYTDLPFEKKIKHYLKQNLLARSLHQDCYERDPGFKRFLEKTGLPFRHYTQFKKADLDERQTLYQALAEQVWSPSRLDEALM